MWSYFLSILCPIIVQDLATPLEASKAIFLLQDIYQALGFLNQQFSWCRYY